MSGFNKILISCKQATYLHEKKKAGKIGLFEGTGLWIHLLYCRFCRLFIKQVEQLEIYAKQFRDTQKKKNAYTAQHKAELQKAFNEALKNG